MTYPPNWPKCVCGEPVLDAHLTCGRASCHEAAARDRRRNLFAHRIQIPNREGGTDVSLFFLNLLHRVARGARR